MGAAGQVNEGASVKVSILLWLLCYGKVALIIERGVRNENLLSNMKHFGARETYAPHAEID